MKKNNHKKAFNLRRRWVSDKREIGVSEKNIPLNFDENKSLILTELGDVEVLDYRSDKYGGVQNSWTHEFKKKPKLYSNADGTCLIIYPVKVQRKGII